MNIDYYYFFILTINLFIVFFINKINNFINIWDYPNSPRKIHAKPVSLTSFVFILINIFLFILHPSFKEEDIFSYFLSNNYIQFCILSLVFFLIFFIGLYDDKYTSPPFIRLVLLACIFFFLISVDINLKINSIKFTFTSYTLTLNNLSIIFTMLCMIVFLIAMNMFDGINLQAVIFYLCFFLILAFKTNNFFIIAIIISLLFIFYLNIKEIIFLGDAGNYILSFILSVWIIKYYNIRSIFYADEIIIYMIFPIIDFTRVFVCRLIAGKNPMSPDKIHIHHLIIAKIGKIKGSLLVHSMTLYSFVVYNFLYKNTLFIIISFACIYIAVIMSTKNYESE
jgi:UDP-GlcNAc:undecaprenyl-phosphate GlcNAc-1-phosphate transferase